MKETPRPRRRFLQICKVSGGVQKLFQPAARPQVAPQQARMALARVDFRTVRGQTCLPARLRCRRSRRLSCYVQTGRAAFTQTGRGTGPARRSGCPPLRPCYRGQSSRGRWTPRSTKTTMPRNILKKMRKTYLSDAFRSDEKRRSDEKNVLRKMWNVARRAGRGSDGGCAGGVRWGVRASRARRMTRRAGRRATQCLAASSSVGQALRETRC